MPAWPILVLTRYFQTLSLLWSLLCCHIIDTFTSGLVGVVGIAIRPAATRLFFVSFANGRPAGDAEDILTDFLSAGGAGVRAPGRRRRGWRGRLLVAGDVSNAVWRITPLDK